MFMHDYIKMLYISMGYLPGHSYYLITDKEMFEAFLKEDGVFNDFYPCPSPDLEEAYNALRQYIVNQINSYTEGTITELPAWIYSYMIIKAITYESDIADIGYLTDMMNIEFSSSLPEFNAEVAENCYEISARWIQKQPSKSAHRPPTMFGEPHVTKSLRLSQANILL